MVDEMLPVNWNRMSLRQKIRYANRQANECSERAFELECEMELWVEEYEWLKEKSQKALQKGRAK